ncbi:hypothetical protein ACTQW9_11255 [Lachnospiraceae bacterium LCP19S3_B12]
MCGPKVGRIQFGFCNNSRETLGLELKDEAVCILRNTHGTGKKGWKQV